MLNSIAVGASYKVIRGNIKKIAQFDYHVNRGFSKTAFIICNSVFSKSTKFGDLLLCEV